MTDASRKGRGPLEDVSRNVDRVLQDLDKEAERLIAYLNDEVVPAVRDHSSRGLRVAARELTRFAEYLERTQKK